DRRLIQPNIANLEVGQLLNSGTRIVQYRKQCDVTAAVWACKVRLIKDELERIRGQVIHHGHGCLFRRDGENFLIRFYGLRIFNLDVSEERVDTGEALVACRNRVFSVVLEPREKTDDERFVDLSQAETFNGKTASFPVSEKESERLPIRLDRIGAHIALPGEIIGQVPR